MKTESQKAREAMQKALDDIRAKTPKGVDAELGEDYTATITISGRLYPNGISINDITKSCDAPSFGEVEWDTLTHSIPEHEKRLRLIRILDSIIRQGDSDEHN